MAFVATAEMAEAEARAVAEALAEHESLASTGIGAHETAAGRWQVAVYFGTRPTRTEKAALDRALIAATGSAAEPFAITWLPETNWVARSLSALAPVRAGRFVIHGRHDRSRVLPNDVSIEIEAGQAFGTGHHGTTAGCLIAIDRLAGRRPIRRALDVGTGTGVLAIAVAKLTNARVIATDIDAIAVAVARENARLNGMAGNVRIFRADGLGRREIFRHAPYDLIVANILAGPLVALAPAIRGALAPQGSVVLSGLLQGQQRRVAAVYRALGLRRAGAIAMGEWMTLLMKR